MRKKFNIDNLFLYDNPDNEEMNNIDIASRIFALSDQLSEEIVLNNIDDHLSGKTPFVDRVNYVTFYREKLDNLRHDPDNLDLKDSLIEITERVINKVLKGLHERYSIQVGKDLSDTDDVFGYLENIETLYEFFFVRNYENIKDVLYNTLITKKAEFVERYKEIYAEQDEDIFITTTKKKFKNSDDAIIVNYISDIIYDIRSMFESGYDLFKYITNLDLYEFYNNKMNELLLDYGESIVFASDSKVADKYFSILNNKEIFISLRNDILFKYLETVEVDETYGNA